MAALDSASASGQAFAPMSRHITKSRLLVALSLILTWCIAGLLPTYTPQIRQSLTTRLTAARLKLPTLKVDWAVDPNPRTNYDPRKLALIIEPRPLPHLAPHLLHMMSVVPPDWPFLFIGSLRSILSISRAPAILHRQMTGKLDFMVLPEPWEIEAKEDVHRLMTDLRFYDEFLPGVEWILKFESDAILCANSEESLNDWLDWSWAGAPRTKNDRYSGNGGLSLRRVSAIRRVLAFQARHNDTDPEDEWFGKRLLSLPEERVTSSSDPIFTVEDVYHERPMGFHVRQGGASLADGVWKDQRRRKGIFEYCPELGLVMDMKLERERCEGDNGEGGIGPTDKEIKEAEKKKEEERKKKEEEKKQKEDEEKKKKEDEEKKRKEEEERQRKEAEEKEKEKAVEGNESGGVDIDGANDENIVTEENIDAATERV